MEYSLEFGRRLIEAAENVHDGEEADRTVLYLSLLACEINLKALLERAGFSIDHLSRRSHGIHLLIDDVANCQFIDTGNLATQIRAKTVVLDTANGTVGTLLTQGVSECSKYPNEIRYGEIVVHYPPSAMLMCARVVNEWCSQNFNNLRRLEAN